MRLRMIHLWVIIAAGSFLIHWYAGSIVTIAAIIMIIQDNDIEKLKKEIDIKKSKEESGIKELEI